MPKIPELRYTRNTLILPTFNCHQSLAESCSGGDLDGDTFTVIWDQRFVPPLGWMEKPLDYKALDSGEAIQTDHPTENVHLAESFISCMKNDALGRIAHMHLAIADKQEMGAMDLKAKDKETRL